MLSNIRIFLGKYYKAVILFIFVFVVIAGMQIISNRKTPTGEKRVSPKNVATSVEGITTGMSDESELESFGEPRSIDELPDGSLLYKFGPEKSPRPIEVVVEKGKIVFIKKFPAINDKVTLDYYLKTYGESDLGLFYEEPGFIAHVYLDEGIVIVADDSKRENVYELRYFVPTSEENFLETWGSDLLSEPPLLPPLYY